MNNLVIDTDIFIDLMRGFEKAKKYFEELRDADNIVYFSAVTEIELVSGKECNEIERKSYLLNFLSYFTKVPVDNNIAVKAGDFRRLYGINFADATVAATAYLAKATLITRNAKDYKKIKEINLKIPY